MWGTCELESNDVDQGLSRQYMTSAVAFAMGLCPRLAGHRDALRSCHGRIAAREREDGSDVPGASEVLPRDQPAPGEAAFFHPLRRTVGSSQPGRPMPLKERLAVEALRLWSSWRGTRICELGHPIARMAHTDIS